MKFDTAYCASLDEKLSIYDVRDLNFDETVAFDSESERFLCPDDACRQAFENGSLLGTFNAKNVNYVRTPHFKNNPTTRHIEGCRYGTRKGSTDEADDGIEEHFPSELLLTRRQYPQKKPTPGVEGVAPEAEPKTPSTRNSVSQGSEASTPDKTSVFAHPVECFVSNAHDKDLLKRMPLKIGEHTASYASFFKKIEYLQDNKGLIYWGRIKRIKDYNKASFSVEFQKVVWVDKKPCSVNVYLSKALINGYRKRKAFLEQITLAINSEQDLYCFFYGVTPELKQLPSKKKPGETYGVFSVDIQNLDHFIIREAPGLEAK